MNSSIAQIGYTPYQHQYWAQLLTSLGPAEESISRQVASSRVDMNPHQVEGALFALRSPLSKGVILADEVGLGKTIEAGLVIAQRWAERRRRLLLIVPASLRKQWAQELLEKFGIKTVILESKNFNALIKQKCIVNPFDQADQLIICSYQFAAKKAEQIRAIPWDLVVFDEAHKLRNIYKKDGSKMAKALADCVGERQKILLSATPLQNSLMELFGLVSVIDPHFFGSDSAFKQQYVNTKADNDALLQLKHRLKNICWRTLRRQVQQEGGINFTKRLSLTQDFTPSKSEQQLYDEVSAFLQRDGVAALTKGNRVLISLVIRKILASSSFAIAGTFQKMIDRLEKKVAIDTSQLDDYDSLNDAVEEYDELDEADKDLNQEALQAEIQELKNYQRLAQGIRENAKGKALVDVLETAFNQVRELGGQRKAVIFTESCRTQEYLKDLLSANGYERQIILMNGSNNDPESQKLYRAWLERHQGSDVISGSKSADMKAAVVEAFRNDATILIATESGAEGINLQFCSLLINYDLPWNPQRVEQRIGRCHRYGQKHDVVVVNFINKGNRADERVFELLDQKFKLFSGVFGASDEILGAIESGVDIEQRILDVYQIARTPDEIESQFAKLRQELDESIQERESSARQILLENFDETVHQVLRSRRAKTAETMTNVQVLLFKLAQSKLQNTMFFEGGFEHNGLRYYLDWRDAELNNGLFFRVGDEGLADKLLSESLNRNLQTNTLRFYYEQYGKQLSDLKDLRGESGWLELSKLTIDSLQPAEFTIVSAFLDSGTMLDETQCRRLLHIPAEIVIAQASELDTARLDEVRQSYVKRFVGETEIRNKQYFDEETQKLEAWADESMKALSHEIAELMNDIKVLRKQSRACEVLDEKLLIQKQIKALDSRRTKKQMEFFQSQTEIESKQEELLDEVSEKLKLSFKHDRIYLIRWELV